MFFDALSRFFLTRYLDFFLTRYGF